MDMFTILSDFEFCFKLNQFKQSQFLTLKLKSLKSWEEYN